MRFWVLYVALMVAYVAALVALDSWRANAGALVALAFISCSRRLYAWCS